MLVYIRHSKDRHDKEDHLQDPKLTYEGKLMAKEKGDKLIDKYGVPDIVYCSPFLRTRQTLKYLLKNTPDRKKKNIRIIYDSRASRHFSKEERENIDVARSTMKRAIPIFETSEDVNERLYSLMGELNILAQQGQVIWCITHTSVYKKLAYFYQANLPSRIPFLHNFRLRQM